MWNRSAPLSAADLDTLDWAKADGLIPAVVQDRGTLQLLMLGYMNCEALAATLETGRATFWSRSKNRLWVKGETSGDFLENAEAFTDCDRDALHVLADPVGPTCHLGTTSCFTEADAIGLGWLARLEQIIGARAEASAEESYTRRLLDAGPARIAQKVGEEGVETALAGATGDAAALRAESADLVFHLLVLLKARGLGLADVVAELRARHAPSSEHGSS
jgi:phosphoribosyl-ATP pyrophosphohydrolase/phosphoribosyl-AMP cyclohydrolase